MFSAVRVSVRSSRWATDRGSHPRMGTLCVDCSQDAFSLAAVHIPTIDGGAPAASDRRTIEAIRVLARYGNPAVKVLTNTRAVYPAGVIAGEATYPKLEKIKETLKKLSAHAWFFDATAEAVKLGNPILGNVIMIGALSAEGDLPFDQDNFMAVISRSLSSEKIADSLKAFILGVKMMKMVR